MNGQSRDNERESVNQFFHILGSVEQQRGCCEVADGKYEITIYTSCWNSQKESIITQLIIEDKLQQLICIK